MRFVEERRVLCNAARPSILLELVIAVEISAVDFSFQLITTFREDDLLKVIRLSSSTMHTNKFISITCMINTSKQ